MKKTAFITGITGQDGSYLAEFLLQENYRVVGLVSSKYNIGFQNINHLKSKLHLESGDLLDKTSLVNIFKKHQPDEVYNLAGLTFVPASWDRPTLTLNINTLGAARLLEIIKDGFSQTRFYQATSSKIFEQSSASQLDETSPLNPKDPYSISKAAAHRLVISYRHKYKLFATSGILYNHESERRGLEFVTRKITSTAAKIKLGLAKQLALGNLQAQQDWGYAPDYVKAMWLMLQADQADDYIIASGQLHSVEDICRIAFSHLHLDFHDYVIKDKRFYRRQTVSMIPGNPKKAKKVLGWQPKVSFTDMIIKMVENDLKLLKEGKKL